MCVCCVLLVRVFIPDCACGGWVGLDESVELLHTRQHVLYCVSTVVLHCSILERKREKGGREREGWREGREREGERERGEREREREREGERE